MCYDVKNLYYILRKLGAKILILASLVLNTSALKAYVFTYTFDSADYVDQLDPDIPGTLSGFITIDTSQVGGDNTYQSGNGGIDLTTIPAWITHASITFTPDSGTAETRTLTSAGNINAIKWEPTSGFDPNTEFVSQFTAFGFGNGGNFSTSPNRVQQFFHDGEGGEFLLSTPASMQKSPSPLPFLGLGTFIYYFRKLKNKKSKF